MKIALVVPGGVDPSGEYRVIPALLALIRRLSHLHEVHVFALRQSPTPATWELAGATIHNVGERNTALRTFLAIRSEHRNASFDVLQAIWSGNVGLLAAACAGLLRIPYLVHVAGGELVCLPEIGYGGSCGALGRMRETVVLRHARGVTAASSSMLELLRGKGVAAIRIPLGVDLDAWPPARPRPRNPADPLRLIHVGSINKVKDQFTLLKALAELRRRGQGFSLDFVGDDVLNGEIQALSQSLGLSHFVEFHGFLVQRQLQKLMRTMHILVMSSRHEAGPVATLEAAASGIPTVGTHVGHIAEWYPDAAISVPIGDATAIADAVCELALDEERRLVIAQNAHKRALSESADHTADEFLRLYDRVISQT